MGCDGSGELAHGAPCRGCDACNGLLSPRYAVTRRKPARTEGVCPWCNGKVRPFGHTDHTPQAVAS